MEILKSINFILLIISIVILVCGMNVSGVCAEESGARLEIISKNLSYGGTISIAFALEAENIDESSVELLVYFSEPETAVSPDYTVTKHYADTVYGYSALVFFTRGIAAKDMTKQIYVRAHAVVDGRDVYSETERYSIAEYAYDMQYRSKISEELIGFGEALLDVGERIQNLLPYNVDNSPKDFYYVAAEGGTVDGSYSAGLFKKGDTVTLRYKGEIPEGQRAVWRYGAKSIPDGTKITVDHHAVYEIEFESISAPAKDVYSFYESDNIIGTRLDFSDASDFDYVFAEQTHKDNSERYGSITLTEDYKLNVAGNPAWYGLLFKNGDFDGSVTYGEGTKYVFEADITYNGGEGGAATSSLGWSFAGFVSRDPGDDIRSGDMATYAYTQYEGANENIDIYGADIKKGETRKITIVYTVGTQATCEVYLDLVRIADAELITNSGIKDTGCAGFGFYFRGASYTNDLDITFDNVFVGVIEAK